MIKYFLYEKLNGRLASYSDDVIKFDKNKFELKKINLTEEELTNLQNNKYDKFKDEKLIIKDDIQKAIDVKEKISKATTMEELKNVILTDLIK
jgi:hypothetical protein